MSVEVLIQAYKSHLTFSFSLYILKMKIAKGRTKFKMFPKWSAISGPELVPKIALVSSI